MKTNRSLLALSLLFLPFASAFGGNDTLPVSLAEAQRLLEGLPNLEGKSEEEVKRIIESNPGMMRRIEQAERKVRSAIEESGFGPGNVALAEALKELESIPELRGRSEKEVEGILATNPVVRGRVSSVGHRLSAAVGGVEEKESDASDVSDAESAEKPLVPDDIEPFVDTEDVPATALDDVFFGEFHWDWGGFDGSKAEKGEVEIAGLKMGRDGLSFNYIEDLSHWGLSHEDYTGALACLFVCDRDGRWVGGKFDWISSSRRTRDFANVFGGYNGWSLFNVPNPTMAAFVIVSVNGKKRSNVIAGMWQR